MYFLENHFGVIFRFQLLDFRGVKDFEPLWFDLAILSCWLEPLGEAWGYQILLETTKAFLQKKRVPVFLGLQILGV